MLWMGGGPSHLDIWDLKPDSEKNGGPFKPIDTSAPGVKITEHLPKVAKQMHHLIDHPLARLEGRKPRSRHVHDAHRLRPQPDGVAPRIRLVLRVRAGRAAVEFRPAALHRDQHARASAPVSWGCRTPRSWCRTPTRRSPICKPPQEVDELADGAAAAHARPGREAVRQPAASAGGRRSQGGLRQDAADDELAATRTPSTSSASRPRCATPTAGARSARAA